MAPFSASWSPLAPLVLVGLLGACSTSAPAPEKQPAAAASEAETKAETKSAANAEQIEIPVLTEEDLALIAADPKDLTVDQRRKRAYARRRQIMQNPDSPTARALRDLAEAHQAGDIDVQPKGSGTWFHTPGSKPKGGRPPAGWRPSDGKGEADAATPPAPGSAPADGSAAAEPPPAAP